MKDFFISYTHTDGRWAEWIALTLRNSGYTLSIQAWDMLPGSNFVVEMHRAIDECRRTIGVLSPDWLAAVFTQPEWGAAFALDPTGSKRKLIPVRVRACEPPGLLRTIVYCDLVGMGEDDARYTLLRGVSDTPSVPTFVAFPGGRPVADTEGIALGSQYPGSRTTIAAERLPLLVRAAYDILALLRTTGTTFEAQARLRELLVMHIHKRLMLNPYRKWEYENFIAENYSPLDPQESRLFATMRSFTVSILVNYNRRILSLIQDNPLLTSDVPVLADLQDHLVVWLAKYEGTFLNNPRMCLLYVGVEEGVPFPSQVVFDLWKFVSCAAEGRELLNAEPNKPTKFEEHSSEAAYWMLDQFRRWQEYRIRELAAKRQNVTHLKQTGGTGPTEKLTDALNNDIELAQILSDRLGVMFRSTNMADKVMYSLRKLTSEVDQQWPDPFRRALSVAANIFHYFPGTLGPNELKAIIRELPIIAHYVRVLRLPSDLPTEWEEFRAALEEWTINDSSR